MTKKLTAQQMHDLRCMQASNAIEGLDRPLERMVETARKHYESDELDALMEAIEKATREGRDHSEAVEEFYGPVGHPSTKN